MIKTGPIFGVLWIHDHHKHKGIEVLGTAKRRYYRATQVRHAPGNLVPKTATFTLLREAVRHANHPFMTNNQILEPQRTTAEWFDPIRGGFWE